ncbi:MAG: carotenoid oxygenase [Acidimicrobiales bacterium]|nr:carotenoid oxygenase [Acidimicrobiales bacterium]
MAPANRYLEGPFGPVAEELTLTDLEVTGALPADLDGRYVRNGPNPIDADPADYHWFLGNGMVHGLRIRDGRAEWYRNRWVRDAVTAEALGEADRGGPHHSPQGDGTVNTNVVGIAGRTLALVEAGSFPIELDDELETIGRTDLDGTLTCSYSAHPKVHGRTGDLHAVTYWWPEESVHHVVIGPDARVVRDVEIPVGGRPMVHDHALSDTRVALFDLPVQFDVDAAMAGQRFPYRWVDDREARVGLLPIDGTADDVVWCSVDPCYVYHPANAVDLPDGSFRVDVVRHPSTFRTDPSGPAEGPPVLARWVVDPTSGKVREEVLDDLSVEFPRFDDRRAGSEYRYAYAASLSLGDPDGANGSVVRYDLENGARLSWHPGPDRVAGEFVVVPRDGSTAEDDAWLVGLVHDEPAGRAALTVLAADDLTAGPVATVEIPVRIPIGFHGNWIPTTA